MFLSLQRKLEREKNQLYLSPNLDVESEENDLQTLVADLSDITQTTVTSKTVLVQDCQKMRSVDSYI